MPDLGYTFSVAPHKERINWAVHMLFNIQDIEQNYNFTLEQMETLVSQYTNSIANFQAMKEEMEYFIELYNAIPDPDPELNVNTEEEM